MTRRHGNAVCMLLVFLAILQADLTFAQAAKPTLFAQTAKPTTEKYIPAAPSFKKAVIPTDKELKSAKDPKVSQGEALTGMTGARTNEKYSMMGKPMHLSCNRSVRDLKNNRVECFGNVYVRRPTELLTADYINLDLATEDMYAEGNVVYFTGETVIYGAKMDFNFATETGIITDGRVESDKYELLGEHIERLSEDEYNIVDGEYTTCRDCPASWRLAARKVNFEVEGYAQLSHVFIKVNDAPTMYVPYALIPTKTKRQTGFLFPRFGTSQLNGFMGMLPFYWAISRSTDATIGLGTYTNRGRKAEGEFRYVLSSRSKGELSVATIKDKTFSELDYQNRWAGEYSHNLELPWKIEQKMHLLNASDRDYARLFPEDIPGAGEPALVSEAGVSRSGRDASIWASGKYIRNNLTTDLVGFDKDTVQQLPSISIATVDHRLADNVPLHWGLSANYSKFWRKGPSFDGIYPRDSASFRSDFLPGQTPIRKADRYSIVPEIYYTARAFDVFELVPSVQYRSFFYTFDTALAPSTRRGYLVTQLDFATTVERIYGSDLKHKIRPSINYSVIPVVDSDDNHPFNKQLTTSGYQFDEADIVPITNDNQVYFVPLGHSITYQIDNKFILKSDEGTGVSYKKVVQVTSGQSINLIEMKKSAKDRKPLSRLFTLASVRTMRVQGDAEYYYYPYSKASTYNLGLNYILAQYTRRLLAFQRSFGLSYSYNQVTTHSNTLGANIVWSHNDFIQTFGGVSYEFPMTIEGKRTERDSTALLPKNWNGRYLMMRAGVTYQSPSQCYKLMLTGSRTFGRGWDISFNLPINLSGSGYTSFTEGGGFGVSSGPGSGT